MKGPESKNVAVYYINYKALLCDNNPFDSKSLISPNPGFAGCSFLVENEFFLGDNELEKGRGNFHLYSSCNQFQQIRCQGIASLKSPQTVFAFVCCSLEKSSLFPLFQKPFPF